MKKLIIVFLLCLPIYVKADLTKKQEEELAFYVTNFITEASKRTDSDGYSLLAYASGTNRLLGYQGKLSKISVNGSEKYKWTFDDTSFVSFMYLKTFNLILTNTVTSKKDDYSGLNLRNNIGNPYQLSDFIDDATNEEHFYFFKKSEDILNSIDDLKIGDLIIIDEHIMLYLGNQKVAHASTIAISDKNLGVEIALVEPNSLKESSILRIKDKIINPNLKTNTLITWIDTNETIDFADPTKKDLSPKIAYAIDENGWVKETEISFNLTALSGLKSYSLTAGEDIWETISGDSYSGTKKVSENGTYYLKVKDNNDIEIVEEIKIKNIDNNKPTIEKLSAISREKYSIIEIEAKDSESGLDDKAYSFDEGETWSSKNTLEVQVQKEYTVLVKDKLGNITSDKLFVYVSDEPTPKINNIIYGEYEENKQKITITTLNCDICKIAIAKNKNDIDKWEEVSNNTYVTYLESGSYVIKLKNANDDLTMTKSFKVRSEESSPSFRNMLIITFCEIVIFVTLIALFINRKNNKI